MRNYSIIYLPVKKKNNKMKLFCDSFCFPILIKYIPDQVQKWQFIFFINGLPTNAENHP